MVQKQTTEITKKMDNNALALPDDLKGSWGAEESSSEDIILPLVLLMHGQSKPVLAGDAAVGQILRSTDGKVLAKRNETFKIIPFLMTKTFRYSLVEIVKGERKKSWIGTIPWNAANTDTPFQVELQGSQAMEMFPNSRKAKELDPKRKYEFDADQTFNFLGILADEEMHAEYPMPMSLSFTRTSKRSGKKIADHFAQCKALSKPPASLVWEIGSELVTGGDNDYMVFTAKQSALTTIDQMRNCKKWFDLVNMNASRFKEDEVEETETVKSKSSKIDDNTAEF